MKTTIDMAREVYGAHTEWTGAPLDRLEKLVALVRADEREQALAAPVQEPDAMGCKCAECGAWQRWTPSGMVCKNGHGGASGINQRLYTTPPAQPAVPDALTSADIQENIEYVAGWNDCRQAMLEMMK